MPLDQWTLEMDLLMQLESQGCLERALDSVDTDLAIALRRMTISTTEECAAIENGQVELRTRTEFANVHVSAKSARRSRTEGPVFCARDAHDTQEGANRHDGGCKRTGGATLQSPMEQIGIAEPVLQKAEAFNDAGPSPANVTRRQHVYLQHIAGFRPVNPDRACERVNTGSIDAEILRRRHPGAHLASARIDTRNVDFVARGDSQSRLKRAIPDRVRGLGRQLMHAHQAFTLTDICNSTSAFLGRALTPTA